MSLRFGDLQADLIEPVPDEETPPPPPPPPPTGWDWRNIQFGFPAAAPRMKPSGRLFSLASRGRKWTKDYAASLTALLSGITAKKAPTGKFSGLEIRPVITGDMSKPVRSRRKKARRKKDEELDLTGDIFKKKARKRRKR